MKLRIVLTVAFIALFTPVFSRFARPQMIPVDRLLKNAESHLKANPDSKEARYILARIHYLAFARSSTTVPAFNEGDTERKPSIAPNWMINLKDRPDEMDERDLTAYAGVALQEFRKLVKEEPGNGLYQLGLGSLLEQIVDWKERSKITGLPDSLSKVSHDQARDSYLAAFRASFGKDSKLKNKPISGLRSLVSYEAGNAFLRLVAIESDAAPDLRAPTKEVKEGLEKIEAIPRSRAITPIVFSMKSASGLEQLLAPENVVEFDLRGYGPVVKTSWIKPETALLVWDPRKEGRITSGQQLFGGYTFQIFRDTGYDALAALDDDGNGIQSRLLLQVHDELVLDVQQDEVQQVEKLVRDGMVHALPLDVPIEVDVGTGTTWLEAH